MTTIQKRKQVRDFLSKNADDKFINMVYAMMMEYFNELKPMTEEELLERNKKSQKDIKAGRLVGQNEVRKKFAF
ncbi:MAG: hypothetical protein HY064_07300 [Bacteroidetes bacterium]|nr:hypothetical protein [Bacteroidota bacterium]